MFSCSRNAQVTFKEKPLLEKISFQINKHRYLIHIFKGTNVNPTFMNLREPSLKIIEINIKNNDDLHSFVKLDESL